MLPITIEFQEDGLFGDGPCNRYWARYTASPPQSSEGQIQIGDVGSTDRTCSAEVDALERRYFEALAKVKDYQTTDEGLILRIARSEWLVFTRSDGVASPS